MTTVEAGDRADYQPHAQISSTLLTPDRLLRWSLGIIYIWFGALKLVHMSPAMELIRQSYPLLATLPLYFALGLFELILGLVLLLGWQKRWVAAAAVMHLLGTFGVLINSPSLAFLPYFPFLTIEGEFVVKNLVLVAAAAALWLEESRPSLQRPAKPQWRWAMAGGLVLAAGLGLGGNLLLQSPQTSAASRTAASATTPVAMTAAKLQTLMRQGPSVVVRGTVVDRCELLNCWITVEDETGKLFVDLAPAGLTAVGLRVGAPVVVQGHLGQTRKATMGFIATQLRLQTEPSDKAMQALTSTDYDRGRPPYSR